MYCKKCGTKQKVGQKFCPKCGTAYPVVEEAKSVVHPVNLTVEQKQSQTPPPLNSQAFPSNGVGTTTPPVNNQKPTPPTVDNLTDKVEDTFEQGKKFVKENVQPQLDKGIENLKSTDWKSKAKKVNDAILHFDVKKVKRQHWIYAGVGCVALFVCSMFFCLFLLFACNGCGGKVYKYTDYVDNTYTIKLYSNHTLDIQLTDYADKGNPLFDAAYGNSPIKKGHWERQDGMIFILMSDGVQMYIADGYLYKTYSAALSRDKSYAFRLR